MIEALAKYIEISITELVALGITCMVHCIPFIQPYNSNRYSLAIHQCLDVWLLGISLMTFQMITTHVCNLA